jgi:hypothetical protein
MKKRYLFCLVVFCESDRQPWMQQFASRNFQTIKSNALC